MAHSPPDYAPLNETQREVANAKEKDLRAAEIAHQRTTARQAQLLDQGMDNQQTIAHQTFKEKNAQLADARADDRQQHRDETKRAALEQGSGQPARPDYSQLHKPGLAQAADEKQLSPKEQKMEAFRLKMEEAFKKDDPSHDHTIKR